MSVQNSDVNFAITDTTSPFYGLLDVADYTLEEAVTPINPATDAGSAGALSFSIDDGPMAQWLLGKGARMNIPSLDSAVLGNVDAMQRGDGRMGITMLTRLARSIKEINMPATWGTFESAILAYFTKFGIPTGNVVIQEDLKSRQVVLPGWTGDGWTMLKKWASVDKFQITSDGSNIYVDSLRLNSFTLDEYAAVAPTGIRLLDPAAMDESIGAPSARGKYIDVINYNVALHTTDTLIYPNGTYDAENGGTPNRGWSTDAAVISVASGEVVTIELNAEGSITQVTQPACVSSVGRADTDASVYSVIDKDGKVVTPSRWRANGGSVTVTVLPDSTKLRVTVRCARLSEAKGPYSLAQRIPGSDGANYSTLRIRGRGVLWQRERYRSQTGVNTGDDIVDDVALTIDNPFIRTQRYAYDTSLRAAAILRANTQTKNVTVAEDLDGGPIGRMSGARISDAYNNWRVAAATHKPGSVSMQLDPDTIIKDHNQRWSGQTFAAHNVQWAGKTFMEFNSAPLWRT